MAVGVDVHAPSLDRRGGACGRALLARRAGDPEALARRRRVDVAGGVDGAHLEAVQARGEPLLERRGAGRELAGVEPALEGRAGLGRGEADPEEKAVRPGLQLLCSLRTEDLGVGRGRVGRRLPAAPRRRPCPGRRPRRRCRRGPAGCRSGRSSIRPAPAAVRRASRSPASPGRSVNSPSSSLAKSGSASMLGWVASKVDGAAGPASRRGAPLRSPRRRPLIAAEPAACADARNAVCEVAQDREADVEPRVLAGDAAVPRPRRPAPPSPVPTIVTCRATSDACAVPHWLCLPPQQPDAGGRRRRTSESSTVTGALQAKTPPCSRGPWSGPRSVGLGRGLDRRSGR